jgi:predicted secreted protein
MTIASALVLYAVLWFLTMFVVLPIRLRTQGDEGEVVPGTQAGAPANFRPRRTMLIVSLVALAIWAVLVVILVWGDIGVRDIDIFNRMGPPPGG